MPGADPGLRQELTDRAVAEGVEALHRELAVVDPLYADGVGARDLVRITRALEVYRLTGRPISELHAEHQRRPDRYRSFWLGLDPGREVLRRRIERRTEAMFATGFVDEVQGLLAAGYGPGLPPMRALGYRAVCRHLTGDIQLEDAKALTVTDTARYSRRQRNWFRSERRVRWIEGLDSDVLKRVDDLLS